MVVDGGFEFFGIGVNVEFVGRLYGVDFGWVVGVCWVWWLFVFCVGNVYWDFGFVGDFVGCDCSWDNCCFDGMDCFLFLRGLFCYWNLGYC